MPGVTVEASSDVLIEKVKAATSDENGNYRIGVPVAGFYQEAFNSDSSRYGGSNQGNLGGKFSAGNAMHGYEQSLELCLPPLSSLVFKLDPSRLPPAAIHEENMKQS